MGWALRFCAVACLIAGSCGPVAGQSKPSIAFHIDIPEPGFSAMPSYGGTSTASFSPDSGLLALACRNKVKVWSVPEGEEVAELAHDGDSDIHCVAFSPFDETLASRDWGQVIRVWRCGQDGWELTDTIERDVQAEKGKGHGGWSLAFSPDGRFLAWHDEHWKSIRTLRVWDLTERREVANIALHEYVKPLELVHYVGFTDDGEWLKTIAERRVSRGYVHEVRYWSRGTFSPGKEPWRVKVDSRKYRMASQGGKLGLTGLILSSDGRMRAYMSPDGNVLELMDMATRKSVVYPRFLPAPPGLAHVVEAPLGHAGYGVPSLLFSHDKRLLAVATFHTRFLLLWEVNTGRVYARLAQPAGFMWPVAFSPNDRYLFAISSLMNPVEPEMMGTVWDLQRENPTPDRRDYPR